MNLRQLQYFEAVARECHFGRAAEKLNIVQPTLSMQIKALEQELGAALFDRSTREVRLTEVGALLLPEAKRAVAHANRVRSLVDGVVRGQLGRLQIAFSSNAVFSGVLQAHLLTFREMHPDVAVQLVEMNGFDQINAIGAGEVDFGYCALLCKAPGLVTYPVGAWPWRIAMSERHPLAAFSELTPDQLKGQRFIFYTGKPGLSGQATAFRMLMGNEPDFAYTIPSSLATLASAAIGLGVVLVPQTLEAVQMPELTFRPIAAALAPSELHLLMRADTESPIHHKYLSTTGLALPS